MRALVFRTEVPRLVAGLVYSRITGLPALFPGSPLVLQDQPEPTKLGDRQVLVRTLVGGICGSDLRVMRVEVSRKSSVVATRRSRLGTPLYPGHETVGRVVAAGTKVRRVSVGDRVAVFPGVFCAALEIDPPCAFCRQGDYSLCRSRQEQPRWMLGGGWSESLVRHESQLFAVSDDLDDESAALVEPLASSVHAVLRRPPKAHDRVLVIGAGMIGLGIVAALRALGRDLDVTVLARHEFQGKQAKRFGAGGALVGNRVDPYEALSASLGTSIIGTSRGNRYLADGFDAVYDAVGSASTFHDALRWCRPRGFVILVGVNLLPGVLDRTPLWRREIDVVGAVGHGEDDFEGTQCTTFQRVSDWLRTGRILGNGLVTHRFRLPEYRRALRVADGKSWSGAVRVLFDFR